jgi:hypothetical protein
VGYGRVSGLESGGLVCRRGYGGQRRWHRIRENLFPKYGIRFHSAAPSLPGVARRFRSKYLKKLINRRS